MTIAIIVFPFLLLGAWPAYTAMTLRRRDTLRIDQALDAAEQAIRSKP